MHTQEQESGGEGKVQEGGRAYRTDKFSRNICTEHLKVIMQRKNWPHSVRFQKAR